jgi:NAD(P)H-nitrite reductase large subunit
MTDKDFLSQIDRVDELLGEMPKALLDDDVLICECFCVSVGDIREVCGETKLVDIEKLQQQFHFSQGCGTCIQRKNEWFDLIF